MADTCLAAQCTCVGGSSSPPCPCVSLLYYYLLDRILPKAPILYYFGWKRKPASIICLHHHHLSPNHNSTWICQSVSLALPCASLMVVIIIICLILKAWKLLPFPSSRGPTDDHHPLHHIVMTLCFFGNLPQASRLPTCLACLLGGGDCNPPCLACLIVCLLPACLPLSLSLLKSPRIMPRTEEGWLDMVVSHAATAPSWSLFPLSPLPSLPLKRPKPTI